MARKKKLPTPPIGTPVAITWFDAWRSAEVQDTAEELLKAPSRLELEDLGFYVGQGDGYVVIAEERGLTENDFRHIHRIPIVNITDLKVMKYE